MVYLVRMTKNTRGVTISSFHLEIEREEKIPFQFRVNKKRKKRREKGRIRIIVARSFFDRFSRHPIFIQRYAGFTFDRDPNSGLRSGEEEKSA